MPSQSITQEHNRVVRHKKTSRKIVGICFITISVSFLLYQILRNPSDIGELLSKTNTSILLLLILLQIASFFLNAFSANRLLSFVGESPGLKNNLKISVMNEMGNHLMPVAGGSITSYIGYSRIGLPTPAIIFLETATSGLLLSQYLLYFFVSVLIIPHSYLALVPKLALLTIVTSLSLLIIAWYVFVATRKKNIMKRFIAKFVHLLGYVFPIDIDEKDIDTKMEEAGKKIVENFSLFFAQRSGALLVFCVTALYFAIDVAMLKLSFFAFGYTLSPALVAFGMLVSLLLSVATLFPGHPGVTETSFVLIFSALGVPARVGILAAVLYRVTSYWLWMPLSIYLVVHKGKNHTTTNTV